MQQEREGKKRCVLLADNHHNMLNGMKELLNDLFEVVVMVANEESLLDTITKLSPDLIVTDLSLPVSNEINIMQKLKTRYPELQYIILSVHDEPTAVKAMMEAGAAGFVLKRSAATDLVPAVQAVRQGLTFISPILQN